MSMVDIIKTGQGNGCSDRLARKVSPDSTLPRVSGLLALLFLLCLAPRMLMAWKLGAVCDDAYYYIYVADVLDHGDLDSAFEYLNLNIYPVLLLMFNKLGIDWVTGGKLWGVVSASLLVLPLFGWVRRLFNDHVATAACFLYAVHPNLIEVAVEPIREATFWFLLTLFLYLFWRAVNELRTGMFVVAGFVLALAVHSRIEAWVLFVPVILWTAFRWRGEHLPSGSRQRLVFGTLACLAVTPLLLVVVNVTMLRHHTQWEFGRLNHFALLGSWISGENRTTALSSEKAAVGIPPGMNLSSNESRLNRPNDLDSRRLPPPATDTIEAPKVSGGWRIWSLSYLKDLARSLGPVSLFLTLVGLWNGRRLAAHRDKLPLLAMSAVILLAIWIRLTQVGNLNGRYFLVLMFFLLPFQALALIDILVLLDRFRHTVFWRKVPQVTPAVCLLVILLAAGWIDALKGHHRERDAHVVFGQYLHKNVQPTQSVIADLGSIRAGYSVNGDLPLIILPDQLFAFEFDLHPPDLIVFSRDCLTFENQPFIIQRAASLGLHFIDRAELPHTDAEFIVMARGFPGRDVSNRVMETVESPRSRH